MHLSWPTAVPIITSLALAFANVDEHPDTRILNAPSAETYSSAEAISGQIVELIRHASATKECAPAPMPTIRLIDRPRNGSMTIRRVQLTGATVRNCPNLDVMAAIILYVSRPGYTGEDHVRYDAITFDGEIDRYDIAISVKPKPD